jgi:hypothetical protein
MNRQEMGRWEDRARHHFSRRARAKDKKQHLVKAVHAVTQLDPPNQCTQKKISKASKF